MVEIKQIKSSRQLKEFIKFPFKLYKDNPCWIPPLLSDDYKTLKIDRNPAFEYCEAKYFMAYKDGKPAGRIAGIINKKYIQKWKNKYARFGWVDFIDDDEVSSALFNAVESWAREKGLNGVHGPLGFCDLDSEGMLIEGFEEMGMFITIYNYPYYPEHLERLGYCKDVDWLEYELRTPREIPARLQKLNNLVMKRLKLRILTAKKSKELLPYAEEIFEILNVAYRDLYGVVELTPRQIQYYIKQYFTFIDPDYVKLVFDENDKMAAFGIAIPSLAAASKKAGGKLFPFGFIHYLKAIKKKNDCLELLLVAVRPDLQGKGIMSLILADIAKTAIEKGVEYAETGPELENNKDVQGLWRFFESRQHKRRRCYFKKLEQ